MHTDAQKYQAITVWSSYVLKLYACRRSPASRVDIIELTIIMQAPRELEYVYETDSVKHRNADKLTRHLLTSTELEAFTLYNDLYLQCTHSYEDP